MFSNVCMFIITVWGTVFAFHIAPYIKSKYLCLEQERLCYWAEVAVRYYEDEIKGAGLGGQKKEKVCDFLEEKGIKADNDELNILIAVIVAKLNKKGWNG